MKYRLLALTTMLAASLITSAHAAEPIDNQKRSIMPIITTTQSRTVNVDGINIYSRARDKSRMVSSSASGT